MDYKYIEQLMERYWNAETSLEEESILRTFFSQKEIPAEMEHLRPLFHDAASGQSLDDDFDARMLDMIGPDTVKAREVKLTQRFMPLFKAAAVVAIILTIGGALQAPWDKSWDTPADYASFSQNYDSIQVIPIQAENMVAGNTDSTAVLMPDLPKD